MTDFPGSGPVISVGEAMVEFHRNGDGSWGRGFAGDTLNVAWAMRALLAPGQAVDYLTRVGHDEASDEMTSFIAASGIGTDRIARDPERGVGLYTIATDPEGERSFAYWRSASAARRLAQDGDGLLAGLRGARLIYLSGITAAILEEDGRDRLLGVLARLRDDGAVIAYDPNFRPKLWPDLGQMRSFAARISALARIMLPTFDDEQAAFGDADATATITRLAGCGAAEIVVKDGTRPATIFSHGETVALPVDRPVQPLDTTGAGDSFNGAYLAGRMLGLAPDKAARAAQRIAARVVMVRGALLSPADLQRAFAGESAG